MLQAKFGLYLGATIVFIGLLWWTHHSADQAGYKRATAEMAKQVGQANEATRAAEVKSREAVRSIESEYQTVVSDLDSKYRGAVSELGAVRVCQSTSRRPMPRSDAPARISDGPAGRAELPPSPSRDIGPDLIALARDADACAARLEGLQAYVLTLF